MTGQLVHRTECRLTRSRQFDEAAVLGIPDLVLDPNPVSHLQHSTRPDFLPLEQRPVPILGAVIVLLLNPDPPEELPSYRETIPGRSDLLERLLIGLFHQDHLRLLDRVGTLHDRMDGIYESRIGIPVLGLLLQHQPQTDAVCHTRR